MGECNKTFHRNSQEHCLAHKHLLMYYLSVYLLFKVLPMSYRTLHCPASVASWIDQQPHCHSPFPDHIHKWEHPSQSFAYRTFWLLHLGLGSNIISSSVYPEHIMATHSIYPGKGRPPLYPPSLLHIFLHSIHFLLLLVLFITYHLFPNRKAETLFCPPLCLNTQYNARHIAVAQ